MAVEWVRSCYTGYWRFFSNDPAVVTRGRYYFVPDETPFLPFAHNLFSADWHYSRDELYTAPPLGEDRSLRVGWDNGVLRVPVPPGVAIGGGDCFGTGETFPQPAVVRTLPDGVDSRCYTRAGLPVPAYPMGGAKVWFRPEELADVAGGTQLSKWKDVSTFRLDLVQSVPTSQPLVTDAVIGTYKAVRFASTQQLVFGQDPSTPFVPVVFGPQMSIYVVAKAAGAGGVGGFVFNGPDTVGMSQPAEALGGRPGAIGGNFSGGQSFTAVPGVATGAAAIYTLRREPETVKYGANGTDVLTTAIDEAAMASLTGIKAWPLAVPAQRLVFVVEVLVYPWQTDPEEHDAIMTYLGAKYGIPVNV